MSTLRVLNVEENNQEPLTDDEMFTNRQSARHVSVAIRRYMEAHLAIKSDQVRRSHMRNEGGSPLVELAAYKVDNIQLFDNIQFFDNIQLFSDFGEFGIFCLLYVTLNSKTNFSCFNIRSQSFCTLEYKM